MRSVHSGKQKNLRSNMKIMNKDYHLTNEVTGKFVVVHPPKSMRPGLNMDSQNPKDEQGRYIRVFSIVDSGNQAGFKGKRQVILNHLPGEHAHCFIRGNKWSLVPIPGITATKKRRQGYQTRTQVVQAGAKARRSPGRPKGSKNRVAQTKELAVVS